MPNKRAPGQQLIGTHADAELKSLVVSAKGRGKSISDFVREALVEKLQRMGIAVDPDLQFPPLKTYLVAETHGENSPVNQSFSTSASGAPSRKRVREKKRVEKKGAKK
jgi:Arc/MetJ-type ribon-helix-helix transcriptional regulator